MSPLSILDEIVAMSGSEDWSLMGSPWKVRVGEPWSVRRSKLLTRSACVSIQVVGSQSHVWVAGGQIAGGRDTCGSGC